MQLITPQSKSRPTLRPGDVVVLGDDIATIVSYDLNHKDKLYLTYLDDGVITVPRTVDEWFTYWDAMSYTYTIYSADEWVLKLVRKEDVSK
jgi:hypothetical protein